MTREQMIRAIIDGDDAQLARIQRALDSRAEPNPHMSAKDVCEFWKFSRSTLERLITAGKLHPVYILSVRRFHRAEVEGLGT